MVSSSFFDTRMSLYIYLPSIKFTREYNKLYEKGVELFTKFNICDIHDNTCQRGRADNVSSFCCAGCRYLTDSGCTAKSIWCKLWLCASGKRIAGKIPEFKCKHSELIAEAGKLCRGNGGRYDISDYIRRFYYE